MSKLLQIGLTACPTTANAKKIAHALVSEKLAACVNIIPAVTSVYEWESKICEENEITLIIKFKAEKLEALRAKLFTLHPYDTPEFIVVDPSHISEKYLAWALK